MTPEELVAYANPRVYLVGSAFYFAPETLAQGQDLGLDGFRFYFLGRGGAMGDPDPAVVTSAFGYFKASLLEHFWTSGAEIVSPRTAGLAYWEAAAEYGRRHLGGLDDLTDFCAAAGTVNTAADPAGLPLFAGIQAMPLVADPPGRAMQLVASLREHRGSAHLLAIRAVGLDVKVAHAIRRPADVEMFGWSAGEITPTDAQRSLLDEAEALTDRLVLPAYAALDEAGANALVAGLDAIFTEISPPERVDPQQ